MVQYFIEPEFCLVPDWLTARNELFKQIHKLLDPVPYLHLYERSNIKTINWIATDGDEAYVLPAYGTHKDVALFFEEKKRIQIQKGNFFQCQGEILVAAEQIGRGLCFKQLAIVFNQTLAQMVAETGNLKDYEFILCKAYEISQEHPFVGYIWSGYKTNPMTGGGFTTILPVFTEDFHKILQYEKPDLHLIPLEVGEVMKYKDQRFIVKSDEEGVYIDDLSNALLNKRRP